MASAAFGIAHVVEAVVASGSAAAGQACKAGLLIFGVLFTFQLIEGAARVGDVTELVSSVAREVLASDLASCRWACRIPNGGDRYRGAVAADVHDELCGELGNGVGIRDDGD